jgi:Domain of unknown function (DUF4352)
MALALLVTGCSSGGGSSGGGGGAAATPTASPTYPNPARTVRFGEVPVNAAPVKDGMLQFTVIGFTNSQSEIFGSHAEFFPKGRYLIVRLVLTNLDRMQQNFVSRTQELLTADGQVHHPDIDAMNIKRQPQDQLIGVEDRIEFDLYFDVPKDAKATAIRFFADPPGPGASVRLPAP